MKLSFVKKSSLILIGLFIFSFVTVYAQDRSKVYSADDIVKEKLETIKDKLDLSHDQLNKVAAIDKELEAKLEAAKDNTEAKKMYKWRDEEYKKVLSPEQFKKYLKEQQAIVDEAQFNWMQEHGTPVEMPQ